MGKWNCSERGSILKGESVFLPRPQGSEFLPVVVLSVCKLLCFPFALDVDADLLRGILADLRASEVAVYLLQVCGFAGMKVGKEDGQCCVF